MGTEAAAATADDITQRIPCERTGDLRESAVGGG